jgi:hypothetical protein
MQPLPADVKLKVSDYGYSNNPCWENDIEPNIQTAIENYLLYGWSPGSFTTALLANDLYKASGSAHPAVLPELKHIVTWVVNVIPRESYGNYQAVNDWMNDVDDRRTLFAEEVSKRIMWRQLNETANDTRL